MALPHLIIGNKNYSSWSFRPWLAMRVSGIDFTEEVVPLSTPDTKTRISEHSRAGRVPILKDNGIVVWESLAIIEYLAERFPDARLWPADMQARALARSISNEMHAGFQALRSSCPMNMRRPRRRLDISADAAANVRRIDEMWQDCRETYGAAGPFLFGAFSAADAMYAPVVNRFDVYDLPVSRPAKAYMEAVKALPAYREWEEGGRREDWVIAHDEA
jgi:glutathione S-transferase